MEMGDTRRRLSREDIEGIRKAAAEGLVGAGIKRRHIVFTGKMSMRREDMQALARACGAYVEDSVRSYRNGILVTGDTGIHGKTSKMRTAENQGWTIVSEEQFVEMATSRG
jgi:NAD-dependent DNA ligase